MYMLVWIFPLWFFADCRALWYKLSNTTHPPSPFACIVWCCVVEHLTFTLGTHNRFIEGGFRLKDQNKPPTTHFDDLWHKSWRLVGVNIIRVPASPILFVCGGMTAVFVTALLHHTIIIYSVSIYVHNIWPIFYNVIFYISYLWTLR